MLHTCDATYEKMEKQIKNNVNTLENRLISISTLRFNIHVL